MKSIEILIRLLIQVSFHLLFLSAVVGSVHHNRLPSTVLEMEKLTSDLIVHHEEHLVCQCEEHIFHPVELICPVCKRSRDDAKRCVSILV